MATGVIKRILHTAPVTAAARMITRSRPAILMYHGLTTRSDRRDWSQVTADDFGAQMKHVRDKYLPIPFDQLVTMLETGSYTSRAVVVTFDDGYKSNLELALPILEKYNIPATIFITSRFIDGRIDPGGFLWPDLVSMIFLSYPENTIDMTTVGAGVYNLPTTAARYRARKDLVEQLKATPEKKKQTILRLLINSYGGYIDFDHFSEYRPMTREELARLAGNSLISVGAHSRTHPILSRIERGALEDEIIGSKNDVEEMTGSEVAYFAYPNGRLCDINQDITDIAGRHFRCAVITEPGLVRQGDNKYLLRRVGIGSNLSLKHFNALLSGAYYLRQKPLRQLRCP